MQKNSSQNHSINDEEHLNQYAPSSRQQNPRLCIDATNDTNSELVLMRYLPDLRHSFARLGYVTDNELLASLLQKLKLIDERVENNNSLNTYDIVFREQEVLDIIRNENTDKLPGAIQFQASNELQEKLTPEWMRALPRPYIGINWSTRNPGCSTTEAATISLSDLTECFQGFSGTLFIVQSNPTQEELEYINTYCQSPVLNCSDMLGSIDNALAVISPLDDLVGVPGAIQEIRSGLNLPAKVLWPKSYHLLSESINLEDCQQWYPNAKVYLQSTISGWKTATDDLKNIFQTSQHVARRDGSGSVKQNNSNSPDLSALIEHCAKLTTDLLEPDASEKTNKMVDAFNAKRFEFKSALNIFVYHSDVGKAGQVIYRDVRFDLNDYDYHQVLEVFIASVRAWHEEANIYLVSNLDSAYHYFEDEKLKLVKLDVATDMPMYERVNAMYAYVHSSAFNADTMFLDSDAFINHNFNELLVADFDIALTTRISQKLMPVNEGVIIARNENKPAVQTFFRRYLATYNVLCNDPYVNDFYGDIRKWRGGQLSLNAVSFDLAPYSPYRQLTVEGTRLRVLPCDIYNYSWIYGQSVSQDELQEKYVIHVKGTRKNAIEKIIPVLNSFKPEIKKAPYLVPHFAVFNKMYNEKPLNEQKNKEQFVGHLINSANLIETNQEDSGALLADDMFVWFRNLGFLTENEFVRAFSPYRDDQLLRARIWRVYMLCWAVKSCLQVEGDFVDLGCYDGRTVDIMLRYIQFKKCNKQYYLYDLFENPTPESRKSKHGPNLYHEVCRLFQDYDRVKVIQGPVPESFSQGLPDKIAFAQIDLNEAEPEMAALKVIYERITPGGMIIFDDFGFKRYSESHHREMKFFRKRGDVIFESPTGQGLFIKRT